jgi:phenylalanyl-tRNA synthetase beta chain
MPVVNISVQLLNSLLRKEFPLEQLVGALEQLGCDVEDSIAIALYRCPRCESVSETPADGEAVTRCGVCGLEDTAGFPKIAQDNAIRIDLLANRPDLFNVTGLARALRGYLELETGLPAFACQKGSCTVHVDPATKAIRPYIVAAVMTIPALDHTTLRELMKLQENLHWGVGRDRKLASIGIYDMATITGPISYRTIDPDDFRFHPLGLPGTAMTGRQILKEHPKGVAYAHLLESLPAYPLLIDAKGQALSMPPIINSEETKCRIGTTRLFIDVTGLSRQAVTDSLNIIVCSLTELGGAIETVQIVAAGRSVTCPDLTPRSLPVSRKAAAAWLGIELDAATFERCIAKMRMLATPLAKAKRGKDYLIEAPAFRSDLRHEVDVFEDVMLGYGLQQVPQALVPTLTVGQERPEERLGMLLRSAMTGLGFFEIMSLNLNSAENLFAKLRLPEGERAVQVENPKTALQGWLRPHMLAGLLETLEKNRRRPVPQRIFEIGSATVLAPQNETGVAEYRHLGFAVIGPEAGYANGRAVLDALLAELGLTATYKAANHPSFIEGRCAEALSADGVTWARLGEVHPEVLTSFNLACPAVIGELRFAQVY